jgi:hypothetical protein
MKAIIFLTPMLIVLAMVLFFSKKADVHDLSEYKGYRATNIEKFGGRYVSITLENTLKDGHKTIVTKEFVLTDVLPLLHFKNDTIQ